MNRNLINLESELISNEVMAFDEEEINAKNNYAFLEDEYKKAEESLPYKDITPYETAFDLDEVPAIQGKKRSNKPYWDRMDLIKPYRDRGNLYNGRVIIGEQEFYLMEGSGLSTHLFKSDHNHFHLINVDDRGYQHIYTSWRFPGDDESVMLSRNIGLINKKVKTVETVLDRGSAIYSGINDSYLRNALLRNKDKAEIESIIQTIQKKQDDIRVFDKRNSFIVQGCAGSGKTMVLLHRLRYLLFNKEINNSEYVLLVPGDEFKDYIGNVAGKFSISKNNILTYAEYYQKLAGSARSREVKKDIANELVFSNDYLTKVYSREFISSCYQRMFNVAYTFINGLVEYAENKLNKIVQVESEDLDIIIQKAKQEAFDNTKSLIYNFGYNLQTKTIENIDSLDLLIEELDSLRIKKINEIEYKKNLTINDDDERILNHHQVRQLSRAIETEEAQLKSASVFTRSAHQRKLNGLKQQYESSILSVKEELLKQVMLEYADTAGLTDPNLSLISLDSIVSMLEEAKDISKKVHSTIESINTRKETLLDDLQSKYAQQIDLLNDYIESTESFINCSSEYVSELKPSPQFLLDFVRGGESLYKSFINLPILLDNEEAIVEKLRIFRGASEQQILGRFSGLLFNACRQEVKTKFNVKMSENYKHYWYLNLYANYLTRGVTSEPTKYMFIDEAQDLSPCELNLLHEINETTENHIIMNVFGDVNQMITNHGVKNWSQLNYIYHRFELDENFRNTNQIIEYCNSSLPFKMKKIGVDLDMVTEYLELADLSLKKEMIDGKTFIVKDEYALKDLKIELEKQKVTNYSAYTVKNSKGLEFKEVFVIDRDMSINERYIAYTRALSKLTVIKSIPRVADTTVPLIIEGSETESDDDK